jgi:GTPase Era involved in 16S rRNA processing
MKDTPQTRKMIKNILWDSNKTIDEVMFLLSHKKDTDEKRRFITRMLKSFNWYKLLVVFSPDELKEIVSDDKIILSLFPNSLREKYKNVREILQ